MSSFLKVNVVVAVIAFHATGCVASADRTPMPTATLDIAAMVGTVLDAALDGTATLVPTPSATATLVFSNTLAPTPTPTVLLPSPKPTSAGDQRFAAQRTRLAPTLTVMIPQMVKLINKTGIHHQWKMITSAAPPLSRERTTDMWEDKQSMTREDSSTAASSTRTTGRFRE